MAYTEFCCRSGGSNMNGGAIASGGEPATSPVYTATNGDWNSGTGVFTPTSGDPSATVTVGDFAHVFLDGATTPVFVARVTAVNATTITTSTTVAFGTAPTTAGTGISINVGGAWSGPSGAVIWPFGSMKFLTNAVNAPRVNLKNDQTYSISASLTANQAGPTIWQGYTSTFGDGGRATIDGSTNTIALLNFTTSTANEAVDLICQNNGASGSNAAFTTGTATVFRRCVANTVRGAGFLSSGFVGVALFCEAYACNASNTASSGGFVTIAQAIGCISHDHVGSNNCGFVTVATMVNCIADTCGLRGVEIASTNAIVVLHGCELYNNASDGVRSSATRAAILATNCNFINNGTGGTGYGINITATDGTLIERNCGFGGGTEANTTGTVNVATGCASESVGRVTYANDVTPWTDPANGDFRISLAAAKGVGYFTPTQTAGSYAGTVGYPDIGAAQHQETASGGSQRVYGA
jgi:hypothetical protein